MFDADFSTPGRSAGAIFWARQTYSARRRFVHAIFSVRVIENETIAGLNSGNIAIRVAELENHTNRWRNHPLLSDDAMIESSRGLAF
jgi:hypothetical protein